VGKGKERAVAVEGLSFGSKRSRERKSALRGDDVIVTDVDALRLRNEGQSQKVPLRPETPFPFPIMRTPTGSIDWSFEVV
jgi:hypothetical protein